MCEGADLPKEPPRWSRVALSDRASHSCGGSVLCSHNGKVECSCSIKLVNDVVYNNNADVNCWGIAMTSHGE